MSTTGYIGKDGIYHRVKKVPVGELVTAPTSVHKQADHAKQRFDHAAEIIQPYDHDGNPNPAMIEAWPEDAVLYGFLPGELEHDPAAAEAAHGSRPWGG